MNAATGEEEAPEKLVNYWDYLNKTYDVTDAAKGEENQNTLNEKVLSFADKEGLGSSFNKQRERMIKALSLPKGAKEVLGYGPEVAQKVEEGQPLWEEEVRDVDPDAEEDEEALAASRANNLDDD